MTETTDLTAGSASREFTVQYQKVYLDIDFRRRAISGKTEILVLPESKELKTIRLNCRQTKITSVSIEGKTVNVRDVKYTDPYACAQKYASLTANQHHQLRSRIGPYLEQPPAEELHIPIPRGVRLTDSAPTALTIKLFKTENDTPAPTQTPMGDGSEQAATFLPLKVEIAFETAEIRDGLFFVGFQDGDTRYPHVYTNNSPFAGTACSLFPCVDDPTSRHPWDVSVRCPRTLGDAFAQPVGETADSKNAAQGTDIASVKSPSSDDDMGLSENDKALDLSVICSGNLTDEIVDSKDPTRKTVSFSTASLASAHQIGFAIGPFEDVDLSEFREIDDDEKLGTQAVRVHGYCLPGRAAELRNTCMHMAKAVDFFTTVFTAYTGDSYKMCFVEDLSPEYSMTAGLSICSTRLLFPEDVLDPLDTVPRLLTEALAAQYSGIALVAREAADAWLIAGMRMFMADSFMKVLTGNNEYRYRQKLNSDRVHELDRNRPALYGMGPILHLDPMETEFMTLKAGVVLFILDRRLTKSSGSAGISRIISRFLTTSKGGDADATFISTSMFHQRCQKMGHLPLDSFFEQWVYSAGCPTFQVTQRFNKKRMVVEMLIRQVQGEAQPAAEDLDPNMFLRDLKEEDAEVYAGYAPTAFVGPMTIRIHEADGTPYEHIVDIKEINTRFEIPYNTKYNRLARSRWQKERLAAKADQAAVNGQDDVLLYCLGDVLQSQDEVGGWRLTDWSKEDEDRMNQESFEWIRMDADFEWICKLNINMPAYMFVSQLQQDRDVVAQMDSLQYISAQKGHPLISTILTRTVMDKRYFHGVRTMAAEGLTKCATEDCDWIGLFHLQKIFHELFCLPNSTMMQPNDFSNRAMYFLQCRIPRAIGKIKDSMGEAPVQVKKFFLDKLKFNDNSENEFSDNHYIAILLTGLSLALADGRGFDSFDEDVERDELRKSALTEIDRFRRIDEWIASYQNLYSITALECLLRLAQGRVYQPKLRDFLQYTRVGNGENLRLKAFECLIELGMLKDNAIFKYFVYTLAMDSSAYFRYHAYQILGKGLARIALGDKKKDIAIQAMDGLIIEQEGSTETRQTELARRQTIPGAVAGLKEDLGSNLKVKDALWAAVMSPVTNLAEVNNFLELCSYLYDPVDKLEIVLYYPRYWKATRVEKAVLAFTKTKKIRTKKRPPLEFKVQEEPVVVAAPVPPPVPATKIKLGVQQVKPQPPEPPKPKISLKPKEPKATSAPPPPPPTAVIQAAPKAAPTAEPKPAPAATPKPAPAATPKPTSQPLKLKVSTKPVQAHASTPTPAAPKMAALPATKRKPSQSPATTKVKLAPPAPAAPARASRVIVFKISKDRLGKYPSGVRGTKGAAPLQTNGTYANGHTSSRASTPAASVKSGKAMSPPARSAAGGPPAKKQKIPKDIPAKPGATTSASPAPQPAAGKKRKNSTSSTAMEPPSKRPVLKLKLKSMARLAEITGEKK